MAAGRFSSFFRRAASVPWSSIAGEAFDRVVLVAKSVCFVHVINNYVCSVALVRGPSMLPNINMTGDIVAVERISPRWNLIGVGDIVLLRSPENPMKTVTKRVLGLEGDKVTFLVDPSNGFAPKTVLVPKGHVWVQGDNIYESRDSRQFGPVPYGLIHGRAFCRSWIENFDTDGSSMEYHMRDIVYRKLKISLKSRLQLAEDVFLTSSAHNYFVTFKRLVLGASIKLSKIWPPESFGSIGQKM